MLNPFEEIKHKIGNLCIELETLKKNKMAILNLKFEKFKYNIKNWKV